MCAGIKFYIVLRPLDPATISANGPTDNYAFRMHPASNWLSEPSPQWWTTHFRSHNSIWNRVNTISSEGHSIRNSYWPFVACDVFLSIRLYPWKIFPEVLLWCHWRCCLPEYLPSFISCTAPYAASYIIRVPFVCIRLQWRPEHGTPPPPQTFLLRERLRPGQEPPGASLKGGEVCRGLKGWDGGWRLSRGTMMVFAG